MRHVPLLHPDSRTESSIREWSYEMQDFVPEVAESVAAVLAGEPTPTGLVGALGAIFKAIHDPPEGEDRLVAILDGEALLVQNTNSGDGVRLLRRDGHWWPEDDKAGRRYGAPADQKDPDTFVAYQMIGAIWWGDLETTLQMTAAWLAEPTMGQE